MNKMLAHCFNPQLKLILSLHVAKCNGRGRVQSSDWQTRLSMRNKLLLNIAFIYRFRHPNVIFRSFNNDIIFQNLFAF